MDPEETARLSTEQMWREDAASRMLGMQVVQVGPGCATVSMTVREDMINGWDVCHGGLVASLADSAFAVACNSHGTVTLALQDRARKYLAVGGVCQSRDFCPPLELAEKLKRKS